MTSEVAGVDAGQRAGGRIPVYSVYFKEAGPALASGRLIASARAHKGGALERFYDIRRIEFVDDLEDELLTRRGPAILLCSDYVWSVRDNLDLARRARRFNSDLIVIHGGPSAPAFQRDAEDFLRRNNDAADVLVRGEGERTLIELLECMTDGVLVKELLREVPGISFLDDDGSFVRTIDRAREDDLSIWPSPYLTGEFDHIEPSSWLAGMILETNRGCPYSCSFCDWGSATLSRVRFYPEERVHAEIRWAARHGFKFITIADANFGITKRDVASIAALVDAKDQYGAPDLVSFCPAKNTVRHLVDIMELLSNALIEFECNVGIQSFDRDVLDAVDRSNISTDKLLDLSMELRSRGLTMPCELMSGLPGQTPESLQNDLQFSFDHELPTRVHPLRIIPNAPLNDPGYRERFQLTFRSDGMVQSSTSFTEQDAEDMSLLVKRYLVGDHFGLFRFLARLLQWDYGIPAMDLFNQIADAAKDGLTYPTLAWVMDGFLEDWSPPKSWQPMRDELERFVVERLGISMNSDVTTALDVQTFLLPTQTREFPDHIELEHDYVAWSASAGRGLLGNGLPDRPEGKLRDRGPGTLWIESDPLKLTGAKLIDQKYLEVLTDRELIRLRYAAYEYLSPLTSPHAYRKMVFSNPDDRRLLENYRLACCSTQPLVPGVVEVGDTFPQFELRDHHGSVLRSADLAGRWYLFSWLPAATAPSCAAQVISLRDQIEAFEELNCKVVGASIESPVMNATFSHKFSLNFDIVSDESRSIALRTGAVDTGWAAHVKWLAYLVSPEGVVRRAYQVDSPEFFAEQVLDDVEAAIA